jgi:hypothetical protein
MVLNDYIMKKYSGNFIVIKKHEDINQPMLIFVTIKLTLSKS